MRRAALLATLAGAALLACPPHPVSQRTPPPPPSAQRAPAPAAPVVVAIVIDQLAAWEAAERFDLLPKTGGFARLKREGLFVPEMRFAHA
ncbi:MAG TPA: hypothetical protein VLM85_02030, partial [Polyangiaceae bacterium]|nr:hypothetical protein [Polyangiaceae bacterium]